MFQTFHQTYLYLSKGGPVLALIFLASIVVVALVVERFMALRREKILPSQFLKEVQNLAQEEKLSEVLAVCRASSNPISRILQSGLSISSKSKIEIQNEFELSGKREVQRMEKNLDALGTLAAVGPLLGLLGTVTGMISTFGVIRTVGVGDPMQLSGGIAEALLNTAGGLIVGIPALVFHRVFFRKIDGFVLEMEEFSQQILKQLKGK